MTERGDDLREVDEKSVRAMFDRFSDPAELLADPASIWIDRPHYQVIAQSLELRTREEVVAWFRDLFAAVPDLRMEVEDTVVAGRPGRERVTVRWRMMGTFSGSAYAGIKPTGHRVELRGMDLVDLEDGRVAANTIYYDQLGFARQIGMLPPEGSLRDRIMTRAFNLLTRMRNLFRGSAER